MGRVSYREDLRLLKKRRFAALCAARTMSMLAAAFTPVALAFGVLDLPGATASTLSTVLAFQAMAGVLFLLVGGVVADRLPRSWVLLVAELSNFVVWMSMGLMLVLGWAPIWALCAGAALSGMVAGLLHPALAGIVPDLVEREDLQAANSLLALGANIARLAGLVSAGMVVVWVGGGWALIGASTLFAIAAVLISTLARRTSAVERDSSSSVIAELREGWGEFRSRQWLWVVVLQFAFLVMALQATWAVLGPVVAKAELGGARTWSWILAADALGMVLGVVLAMRLRPSRPILVGVIGTLSGALMPICLALSAPLWLCLVAAFVQGVSFDVFGVLWQTTMQREVPPEALSRVASYDALGSMMFGPIGILVAGGAAVWIGPHKALLWCGILSILTTLGALCSPEVRQLRAPAEALDDVKLPEIIG